MLLRNWKSKSWALIKKEPLGSITLLLSIFSFAWVLVMNATAWASSDIRSLIESEANAAVNKDTSKAMSLYTDQGTIFDWQSRSNWNGATEIRQRYSNLPQFKWLVHANVNIEEIQLFPGTARARSVTEGVMQSGGAQVLFGEDIWEFKRVNRIPFLPWTGEWKISGFTFDKPL